MEKKQNKIFTHNNTLHLAHCLILNIRTISQTRIPCIIYTYFKNQHHKKNKKNNIILFYESQTHTSTVREWVCFQSVVVYCRYIQGTPPFCGGRLGLGLTAAIV